MPFVAVPLDFFVEGFRPFEQLVVAAIRVGFVEAEHGERRFVVLITAAGSVDASVVVHESLEILERAGDGWLVWIMPVAEQGGGNDGGKTGAGFAAVGTVVRLRLGEILLSARYRLLVGGMIRANRRPSVAGSK